MDLFLLVGSVSLVLGAMMAAGRRRGAYDRRLEAWQALGERLGLELRDGPDVWNCALAGEVDDQRVLVASPPFGQPRGHFDFVRVLVDDPIGIPHDLAVLKARPMVHMRGALHALGVRTGDPDFDDQVEVRGEPADVVARLDAGARAMILRLVRDHQLVVRSGGLDFTARRNFVGLADFESTVGDLLDLAMRLSIRDRPVEVFLRERAATDPLPGVRLRALRLLFERVPDAVGTESALESALEDPDVGVRLFAARNVGASGLPVAAEIIGDTRLEDEARAQALEVVSRLLVDDREARALDPQDERPTLEEGYGLALAALLDALPEDAEDMDVLGLARIAEVCPPEVTEDLVAALLATEHGASEGPLAGLVEHPDKDVQEAARRALTTVRRRKDPLSA